MTDFVKSESLTERDLLSRIWRSILLAFDQGKMQIRDKATNTQIDKKRKLSSAEVIERKAINKRADQLIKFGNYELGTDAGSKTDDEYSPKFFLDSMKKAPKAMKDMLLLLMKVAPYKKHNLI